MGGHPPHGQVPVGVSDPGGETDDRKAHAVENGRDVEIHLGGGGKGGGGVLDDTGISQVAPEHGCTLYRYVITVRPVLGVLEGSWGASRDVVVGTGGT